MAITIGETKYGRDNTAAATLKSDIEKSFNKYNAVISDITDIINVVRKNWAGVDAEKFISTMELNARISVSTNKTSVNKIKSAIDTDISNFNKMQTSNQGLIR